MEAGLSRTLEVPNKRRGVWGVGGQGRQEGATGFTGLLSQSSPVSLLPSVLTTKLSSENTPLPPSQSRRGRGRSPERICGKAGQDGKERRKVNDTSLATKHLKTKSFQGGDAVVGEDQEMSFWKSPQSRRHSCCQYQAQRGFHLCCVGGGVGWVVVCVSQMPGGSALKL